MSLLSAEALHIDNREPEHLDLVERFLHRFELRRLDDSQDQFQAPPLLPSDLRPSGSGHGYRSEPRPSGSGHGYRSEPRPSGSGHGYRSEPRPSGSGHGYRSE